MWPLSRRRRTIDLGDDRLLSVGARILAFDLSDRRFWRALIGGDPSLTVVALILRQAYLDRAKALHVFVDGPGYCARILEYIRVPEGHVELPWRTVDDRDWDRAAQAGGEDPLMCYPVEQRPVSVGSNWAWVQMKPLGLVLALTVPVTIRRVAGMRSHENTGTMRLRFGSERFTAVVEAPEFFDVRVFFEDARPSVRSPPNGWSVLPSVLGIDM